MTVNGQIYWSMTAFVHKILKWTVTAFLKFLMVFETIIKQIIHFFFKIQQLFSKFYWVLKPGLIIHNCHLSSFFNIRIHFVHYELKSCRNSIEYVVHKFELIKFCVLEHVIASCLFFNDKFCLIFNQLCLYYFYNFLFGFWREPVVRIAFFTLNSLLDLSEIFWTAKFSNLFVT